MAEINLLQNRLTDTTNAWQRQSKLTIAVLAAVLVILAAGTGLLFFLNGSISTRIAAATNENRDLQQKLTEQQNSLGNAKTFQAQLINLRALLNNHVFLAPLLDELSKTTYVNAQYLNVDVNEGGKIHMEGRVGSYSDLGKLLLGLSTSSKFNNIKLLSAAPSSGTLNAYVFSVDMNVISDIFHKQ